MHQENRVIARRNRSIQDEIHSGINKIILCPILLTLLILQGVAFPKDDPYTFGLHIPAHVRQYWQGRLSDVGIGEQGYPPAMDWSNDDSPIKNQAGCGSCWAFAAAALIENISGTDDLSEQMIISCAPGSCTSGWYGDALQLAHDEGIVPEACYPYLAANGDCADRCSDPLYQVRVAFHDDVGIWGNPNSITREWLKEVLTMGPVCVAMDVPDDGTFTGYTGGIYNYDGGPIPDNRGHAVLVVGYNESEQYFRAKNSWGPDWGENGYFRISYNDVTDDVHFGGFACRAYDAIIDTLRPIPVEALQILTPNGGEYWIAGQTREILWNSANLSGRVLLEHSFDGGDHWSPIQLDAVDDSAFSWQVPMIRSYNNFIRISDADSSISDVSDAPFTTDYEFLRVQAPNGGEQWPVQSEQMIVWESSLTSGFVSLSYMIDGATYLPIAEHVPDTKSYLWRLPNDPVDLCKIRIADCDSSIRDLSNQPFSITPDSTQIIHVETPNGGESWMAGSTQPISWSSHQISEQVVLRYSEHSDSGWTILDTIHADASPFQWTVPHLFSSNARFSIFDLDGYPEDTSDSSFTILMPPSGTVIAGMACEKVQEGSRAAFPVYVNMDGMDDPNAKLRAYSASVQWDTVLFDFAEVQAGSSVGWDDPAVSEAQIESGLISFSQDNPAGSAGHMHVCTLLLDVASAERETGTLDLNFDRLTSWQTGQDLIPNLEIEACEFSIVPEGILGDVDRDGFVTSTDALIMISCDVGLDVSQFCPVYCGDVNMDGIVNTTDGLILLSYNIGIEVPYPIGEPGCPSNEATCAGCYP